jgi:hypothetical protein
VIAMRPSGSLIRPRPRHAAPVFLVGSLEA